MNARIWPHFARCYQRLSCCRVQGDVAKCSVTELSRWPNDQRSSLTLIAQPDWPRFVQEKPLDRRQYLAVDSDVAMDPAWANARTAQSS